MYKQDEKEFILKAIFQEIEEGISTRKAIKNNNISSSTFFIWIDEDETISKQYARACELRAEALLDEMLDIADDVSNDWVDVLVSDNNGGEIVKDKKVNFENIQRSRLRYDARKWLVSKLAPKKYGDKLEVEQNGNMNISWNEEKTYEK